MAYATVAQLKAYLGISGTADDVLLADLLERATAVIEQYTGKTFVASSGTRRYDSSYVDGDTLVLDEWLLAVTSIVDGAGNTIPPDGYVLLPRNAGRYYAIRLRSDYSWNCADMDSAVSVTGTWGWSTIPPEDIVHACIRLAAYMYRQKDAQVFDVTAFPDAGAMTIPQGIPADVKIILQRYREVV